MEITIIPSCKESGRNQREVGAELLFVSGGLGTPQEGDGRLGILMSLLWYITDSKRMGGG